MNRMLIAHTANANPASITPARAWFADGVSLCRRATPTSPAYSSGRPNPRAHWIVRQAPVRAMAASCAAAFWGGHDPARLVIQHPNILGYTMSHVSAFVVVGCSAAALPAEVEEAPSTLFLVIVGFCFFEFGFYVLVAILAQPLLGALAWWNVAIGNAIAAFGMGYYLWREHPKIGEELRKHPLGETQEGE